MNAHDTLQERIDSAVTSNPYLRRRNLRLESREGEVVLTGNVGTYYQKQMAQEAIKRIDGVIRIDNQINVTW